VLTPSIPYRPTRSAAYRVVARCLLSAPGDHRQPCRPARTATNHARPTHTAAYRVVAPCLLSAHGDHRQPCRPARTPTNPARPTHTAAYRVVARFPLSALGDHRPCRPARRPTSPARPTRTAAYRVVAHSGMRTAVVPGANRSQTRPERRSSGCGALLRPSRELPQGDRRHHHGAARCWYALRRRTIPARPTHKAAYRVVARSGMRAAVVPSTNPSQTRHERRSSGCRALLRPSREPPQGDHRRHHGAARCRYAARRCPTIFAAARPALRRKPRGDAKHH